MEIDMITRKREIGPELFRIAMMLGVCLIHVCGQGDFRSASLHNLLMPCVVGFVVVSGYFGIRFAPSKLVRLYALAIGYCFVIPLIGGVMPLGNDNFFENVIVVWGAKTPWHYWFLHAYAALMCVSVLIEGGRLSKALPFLFLVFGWGFLTAYSSLSDFLPRPNGFSAFSFMTLLGIYIATRFCKERGLFQALPMWTALFIVAILLCVLLMVPGSGMYNSPIAFAFAAALFSVALRVRTLGPFDWAVRFVAPSMFSVYLIHCAIYFPGISSAPYGLINHLLRRHAESGLPIYLNYLVCGLEVFALALLIDILRRLMLRPFQGLVSAINSNIDSLYANLIKRMEKR